VSLLEAVDWPPLKEDRQYAPAVCPRKSTTTTSRETARVLVAEPVVLLLAPLVVLLLAPLEAR